MNTRRLSVTLYGGGAPRRHASKPETHDAFVIEPDDRILVTGARVSLDLES